MIRVAFQGEPGAFSEQGVRQLWPSAAEPVPMREFTDVAAAVQNSHVDFGLLPIENTLAGSVIGSYDVLFAHDALHVVAETVVPIHHCVLALSGATLDSLRTVASHPVALAQCQRFLRSHPYLVARAAYDTAGAAREVAAGGDLTAGAIASRAAAEHYALEIVASDVEDRPDNQTRFVAIAHARSASQYPTLAAGTPARSILIVTTDNVPGALLRVLEPVADHGINLSKLESRPTGEPWTYRFFLELEHAAGDARVPVTFEAVRQVSRSFRLLGTVAVWSAQQAD